MTVERYVPGSVVRIHQYPILRGIIQMYERFTDRTRRVMQLANHQAYEYKHEYVGTEHLLLGLIKEGNGIAATVLASLGADFMTVSCELIKYIRPGPAFPTAGKMPQIPRVRVVIERSIQEAMNLKHNYVGTEHLLLGLLWDDGTASLVLANLGITAIKVREEVMNLLGNSKSVESSSKSESDILGLFRTLIRQVVREELALALTDKPIKKEN